MTIRHCNIEDSPVILHRPTKLVREIFETYASIFKASLSAFHRIPTRF